MGVDTVRAEEAEQHGAVREASSGRVWCDAPMRSKTAVLIVLAAVGGMAAGLAEAATGHVGLPLLVLITIAIAGPMWLAKRAIWQPLERVLHEADHAWRTQRPTRQLDLRMNREDEIGRLAALLHQHTLRAYRQARVADHLRRTLDHRVQRATGQATRQLQEMAMRDPLTELGNRRFLNQHLEELVASCRSSGTDLLCLVLDLDNFKPLNDTLGHAAGDRLLTMLGQLIRGNLRRDDLAVRYGGDEFVLLLPGAESRQAAEVAHRLRELFRQHVRTTLPRTLKINLSVGMASLQHDRVIDGAALIQRADSRLYQAKNAGKGQTCDGG